VHGGQIGETALHVAAAIPGEKINKKDLFKDYELQ
jgi:hypothetical protein